MYLCPFDYGNGIVVFRSLQLFLMRFSMHLQYQVPFLRYFKFKKSKSFWCGFCLKTVKFEALIYVYGFLLIRYVLGGSNCYSAACKKEQG